MSPQKVIHRLCQTAYVAAFWQSQCNILALLRLEAQYPDIEFLDLAVKRCRKLMHKGVVDKSAYLNVSSLADQVFDSYDMSPPDNRTSNNNVLNAHEIIAARKASDLVTSLVDIGTLDL